MDDSTPVSGPEEGTEEVDVEALIRQGERLSDSPDEARIWLRKYGPICNGTDVPRRLVNPEIMSHQSHEITTLLTVLTTWITQWFIKAEKARRENRASRTINLKEQKDLDWVLRLTKDFLALNDHQLGSKELANIVHAVNRICLRTNEQADINNAISILHIVLLKFEFPDEVLEETLAVLSASVAILQEQPDRLQECFEMIVKGTLSQKAVSYLYKFTRTPTASNEAKNLSHARGSTRLLREVLDTKTESEDYVVDLKDLVEVLHDAAEQRIFRFSFDILNICHSLLATSRRESEILALNWTPLIETIRKCLTITPTTVKSPTNSSSTLSPTNEGEHERQYERHLRERDSAAKRIAQQLDLMWQSFSYAQLDLIGEYCLSFPQYLNNSQSFLIISHVENQLRHSDYRDWLTYFYKLMESFVQNSTLSSAPRVKAIEAVVEATLSAFAAGQVSGGEDLEASKEIMVDGTVTGLFEQVATEQNKAVCEACVLSLKQIAMTEGLISMYDCDLEILEKLKAIALYKSALSDIDEERTFLITKALVDLFAQSLQKRPQAAVSAYDGLLDAANLQCQSRRARVLAMRVLFKIRSDNQGYIYLQAQEDVQYIAAALCRTQESIELFDLDVLDEKRGSSSSTSLSVKSANRDLLWTYPEADDLPSLSTDKSSLQINIDAEVVNSNGEILHLDITSWLLHIIRCLQTDTDWETYSYILVHLGSQLSNMKLFSSSMYTIVKLRQVLCEQIVNGTFRDPPPISGLKKSDTALCMFNVATPLIAYATIKGEHIQKGFGDDLVRAFLSGIGGAWEGTSRGCIHALSICSLEIPHSVASLYPSIVDKLSKNMTQSHLTMHILEFLAQVARLPEVHSNFNPNEINMIFGVCIQFLEKVREHNHSTFSSQPSRLSTPARHSGLNLRRPPYRAAMLTDAGLPQYAAALAYHSMIFWFLSLKLGIRAKYVSWIVPRLIWKNTRGDESIDEQSEVFIDMMQRSAFTDLGETSPDLTFAENSDGLVSSASWVVGFSILTVQTEGHTGLTQITKRQASGTTYATYHQLTTGLPPHHAPSHTEIRSPGVSAGSSTQLLPSHILLQMVSTAASTSITDQPVPLPNEEWVTRALRTFDRTPTVDSHKIGILYVAENQYKEEEILANVTGSADYERFLTGLGSSVSLKPPLQFNPHGLEYPGDGDQTIAWRDRVTEIVYHVTTMMPTHLEEDPSCVGKKAHVGNCHVNVIFNRSGKTWNMDNFRSQLNYVNVVITPANRSVAFAKSGKIKGMANKQSMNSAEQVDLSELTLNSCQDEEDMPKFYKVQLLTKDNFPNISPAADPKIVSAAQLPHLIRVIALNANVFSQSWNVKDYDSEFPSSWRTRLQQIKKLKDQAIAKLGRQDVGEVSSAPNAAASGISSTSDRRTPISREEGQGTRKDGLLTTQLDFSRWTLGKDMS